MGSCKRYFVYFVSKVKITMIIYINLAILLVTIGFSAARPGGRDPEAYPYAPASYAEARQSDWPMPPLEVAAAPTEHIEEPYRKSKAPRNARRFPLAPLGVAAEPYAPAAPVAEEANKNKIKAPRNARQFPLAPLGDAAEPYAPAA